jgi:hypothetical protein
MAIFGDPVSPLQAFGYSIALGGLVYYKLGADKLKGHIADGQRAWAEYGARSPVMRKVILAGLIFGGFAPSQSMTAWNSAIGRQ